MILRSLYATIFCCFVSFDAGAADFLIAMSADNPNASNTSPMIRSIAYDPSDNYAITSQKNLLTGFTNTLGVATLGDSLYVSNNSRRINGYTLTSDGAGNLNTTALAGFTTINGTSGQFFRGISVNSNAIVAPYTNAITTVALYDPATGSAASPASFTGAVNKWKGVQAPSGNFYVVSSTQINVYDSTGTFLNFMDVTGVGMRDIVFQDASTFYVSDFSGGTIRKYLLSSATSASLVPGFASSGTFTAGGAWGLALSSDKSQLFYSRYFSDTTNHSQIGRLSTSNGGNNTLVASTGNPYGYQYLAVVTVVPEPASYLLGSLAGVLLYATRKMRTRIS